MIIVLLGPPGVGKGTQAKLASAKYGIAHISTGDMLRASVASGNDLGKKVKAVIDSGSLVSDELIVELIQERVKQADCKNGYILDGFPRTLIQAQALEQMLNSSQSNVSAAIYFELSEDELMKRLAHRRSAEARVDDDEKVQRERLEVYKNQTAPLVKYYREKNLLKTVDSLGTVEEITKRLENQLNLLK